MIKPLNPMILPTALLSSLLLFGSGCSVEQTIKPGAASGKLNQLVSTPVVDAALAQDDFSFPSEPPKLKLGREIYQKSCASCHTAASWQSPAAQDRLAYTTPIDLYLMLTKGEAQPVRGASDVRRDVLPKKHPAFKDSLFSDERWAAIFYTRHLSGSGDLSFKSLEGKELSVASIFGANCAVCHGKQGHGNGPLHSGHASSHELKSAAIHVGLFQPPPANFTQYTRLYNRTDAQLAQYIIQGIYPSAMPPWYGLYDKDQKFFFNKELIWKLVRHVRTFGYKNDLSEDDLIPFGRIPSDPVRVKQAGAALRLSSPTDPPMGNQ